MARRVPFLGGLWHIACFSIAKTTELWFMGSTVKTATARRSIMGPYRALAADGDGTLTTKKKMPSSLVRALEKVVAAGGKLILVTGESLESAERFPHVDLFYRVVAENGAVLLNPTTGEHRLLTEPRPPELLPALKARTGCISGGVVAMMCKARFKDDVDAALEKAGSDWRTILNREDLLVLPPGVSKATGLGAAVTELGLAADQVVSVGDAENDIPLLECSGLGACRKTPVSTPRRWARPRG
jgi:hydroxymethylpyrimidine pyrophosphatase-like HAD family hydrolase